MSKEQMYRQVIVDLFDTCRARGSWQFLRSEIEPTAHRLGFEEVGNPGDLIYAYRFRTRFPPEIARVSPPGGRGEWALRLDGKNGDRKTRYAFGPVHKLLFRPALQPSNPIPLPSMASPEVSAATTILTSAKRISDEQALLARIRTANLIAQHIGLSTAVAFQSHKRTTLPDIGQIEIDEIYVGRHGNGQPCIVPLQAKSGRDWLSAVQVEQDVMWCERYFGPHAWDIRPLGIMALNDPSSAQLDVAVIDFELRRTQRSICPHGDVRKIGERRYRLI